MTPVEPDHRWLEATSQGLQIPQQDLLDPTKSAAVLAYCLLMKVRAEVSIGLTVTSRLQQLDKSLERIAAAINPEEAHAWDAFRERLHAIAIDMERMRANATGIAPTPPADVGAAAMVNDEMGRLVQCILDGVPYESPWNR